MTELERAVQWLKYLKMVKECEARNYPHRAQDVGAVHHCRVLLDALRWVPVSERLPTKDDADPNGCVLGLTKFGCNTVHHKNLSTRTLVTHWRKLPEAPKEG